MFAGVASGASDNDGKKAVVTFQHDIAPLLRANCQPCHYPGGKVFKKMPFEEYRIVKKLGVKLNTRFKEAAIQNTVIQWVQTGERER
jgi:hypothetical protein